MSDRAYARLCAITEAAFARCGDDAPVSEIVEEVKRQLARARLPVPPSHRLTAAYDSVRIARLKRSAAAPRREQQPVRRVVCTVDDCKAAIVYRPTASGAGVIVLERRGIDRNASIGVGRNGRPVCPVGDHGEMALEVTPPATTSADDAGDRARHERFVREARRVASRKAMPKVKPLTPGQAERYRALRVLVQGITDQRHRGELLRAIASMLSGDAPTGEKP